ncbi:MBL fold metallo-hydrolase [Streptomyces griseoruber]|uniref:MBL fold metallo-hydrolase n=1 Tax=Streptomyces griseoruber TaxID=1943 RepID=A0A101TAC1_9ACTN|nr:MBL fold metallo-hydrolase [Streptomyces griseoruber]
MFFADVLKTEGLGNRSYLAGGARAAVVVDPPRDIDRVIAAAARRGVRIVAVAETHVHNDYVTGGLELARLTGARYLVPAGAEVAYPRVPVADGDLEPVDEDLVLRAVATPGHTPHHTAYVLQESGRPVAAFTGGSLLIGSVGRPDLVEPRLTERLARAQHASAHRLAAELGDEVSVLPTHGFGSFCSAGQAGGESSTIGAEKASNPALAQDVDTFVKELLAGLDDVPAYYAHMGPANAGGPAPVDLTPPRRADAAELARRLAAGEWVVDLRGRVAFAEGHVAGAFNFEVDGQLATYLAWMVPWGKPVTLLAASAEDVSRAQRELIRVGIDRPAAAAVGSPADWLPEGTAPASFPRSTFAGLAAARARRDDVVVLDVRREGERAAGWIEGSVHIPVHQLHRRLDEVPAGTVWVHCAGGMRAAIAASLLDAAGRAVVAVDDGFAAAAGAGLRLGTSRVTPAQAHRLLQAGSAVLVDVREEDEFAAGHAPGAVHLPLSVLADAPAGLPDGRDPVLICRSGNRSRQAAELLAARGVSAPDVVGGMREWAALGLPVESARGAAGTVR